MKPTELKNYTIKELNQMLADKRVELSKLKINIKMGRSASVHESLNLKKDIARVLTELNQRRTK